MGDDFEELRKPLQDLQQLRNFDPRRAVTKHLFEDVDSGNGDTKPNGHTPPRRDSRRGKSEDHAPNAGEKAPFDPDAT